MTLCINKPLTNIKLLEILAEGVRLEDFINQDLRKAIQEKFPHHEVRFSEIDVILFEKSLIDKEKIEKARSAIKSSKDKKEIEIPIDVTISTTSITLKHRTENDYTNSRIIIESQDEDLLKEFLDIFGVK